MKRVRRDERGSALIIALVFLVLFSLWLTVTLTSTSAGLHADQTQRIEPSRLYSADGAIESAIQQIRFAAARGVQGDSTCDGTSTTLNGRKYYVQCSPASGSGQNAIGGSSPTLGILALSDGAGGTELGYVQGGNSIVRLDGGVYSNTPILLTGGSQNQLNLCPGNKKTVTDAVVNKSSKTVTSLSANFQNSATSTDVGVPISGVNLASGTTIQSVTGPTTVVVDKTPLSSSTTPTTSSGSTSTTGGSLLGATVTFREDYPAQQVWCHPEGQVHGKLSAIQTIPATTLAAACPGANVIAVAITCNPGIPDGSGVDPGYLPDQDTFANDVVPCTPGTTTPCIPTSCPSSSVIPLSPGRYRDADALSNITSHCNATVWFQPGVYDFDFNSTGPAGHIWTIGGDASTKNLNVVGGAPNWKCAPPQATACPLAGADSNGVLTGSITAGGSVIQAASSIFVKGDTGYINSVGNLPYGTRYSVSTTGDKADLLPPPNSGFNVSNTSNVSFTLIPDSMAQGSASMCKSSAAADHPGIEFIFGGDSRVELDGTARTELCAARNGNHQQVAWYGVDTPYGNLTTERGTSVGTPPYYAGNGTALLKTRANGSKPEFIIHGTFYAPRAAIDLSLFNVGYQVVSRGIIARVINITVSPSSGFTDPIIYSPDFGSVTGADRVMTLTACLDKPCSSGGIPKIRALIRIQDHEDPPRQANVSVGYRVKVVNWNIVR